MNAPHEAAAASLVTLEIDGIAVSVPASNAAVTRLSLASA